MNIASARFQELQKLVKNGEEKRPRTEAEEDQLALEDMIFLIEGAYALARYRRKWREQRHSLKLNELSPEDRTIIERERSNQKDYPDPPRAKNYAPRPEEQADDPAKNSIPVAWMRDH